MPRLTTACILTAWTKPLVPTKTSTMSTGLLVSGDASFGRLLCVRQANRRSPQLAAVVDPAADDPDLMMMRRVCRRCAPDEARARVIAAGLLPYVTGGAA